MATPDPLQGYLGPTARDLTKLIPSDTPVHVMFLKVDIGPFRPPLPRPDPASAPDSAHHVENTKGSTAGAEASREGRDIRVSIFRLIWSTLGTTTGKKTRRNFPALAVGSNARNVFVPTGRVTGTEGGPAECGHLWGGSVQRRFCQAWARNCLGEAGP